MTEQLELPFENMGLYRVQCINAALAKSELVSGAIYTVISEGVSDNGTRLVEIMHVPGIVKGKYWNARRFKRI